MIYLKEDTKEEYRLQIEELELTQTYYKDMIDIIEQRIDIYQKEDKDSTSFLDKIDNYNNKIDDISEKISDISGKMNDLGSEG